ncbi:MAG: ATP-binding protein [Halanaerobiales bacterium]|nr:ATP-binding protein [Halanaerobiales bacterium]
MYIVNSGVFKQNLIDFTENGISQDILCLTGVNGTGKTTIMELIVDLMSLIVPNFGKIGVNRKRPNILTLTEFAQLDILFNGKIISIVVGNQDYIQKDSNYEQMFIIENEIKDIYKEFEDFIKYENESDDEDLTIHALEYNREQLSHLVERLIKRKIVRINEESYTELFDKIQESLNKKVSKLDLDSLPLIYYFATNERTILDIRHKTIPKYEIKYDVVHRYQPSNDDLNSILMYYDYAYPEKFEDLKKWINSQVLTDKKLIGIDRPEFKAVIQTKDGNEHGLELLSSGEENLLIIAIQLYLKASKNTVFLVDEADQGLHPEFQEKLMRLIKNIQQKFNCQIILSTHSRYIWKFFDDKAIIRLTELIR